MTLADKLELGLYVSLARLFKAETKYTRTEDTIEAQLDEQIINGYADYLDERCSS